MFRFNKFPQPQRSQNNLIPSENREIFERQNAGQFGNLPDELINKIVKLSSPKSISNLSTACRFFGFNSSVKNIFNGKSFIVEVGCYSTIILRDGHVFILGNYPTTNNDKDCFYTPTQIMTERPIIKIAAGNFHVLLLDDQYNCFGFRYNDHCELGAGQQRIEWKSPRQIELPNNDKIIDIVAGANQTFLHSKSGAWYALGNNFRGELGIGHNDLGVFPQYYKPSPLLIRLFNNKPIVKIVSTNWVSFAQDDEGQWYGCGKIKTAILSKSYQSPEIVVYRFQPVFCPDGKNIIDIKLSSDTIFAKVLKLQLHYFLFDQLR